ncbi:hypothetical protein [Brevibacillus laterosporus]|nr:hypothetical protein [Brevibacillus laterosporus]
MLSGFLLEGIAPPFGISKKRPPLTLPASPAKSLRVLEADDAEAVAAHLF